MVPLDLLRHDSVKVRRMLPNGSYADANSGAAPLSAQDCYLEHSLPLAPTVVPPKRLGAWLKGCCAEDAGAFPVWLQNNSAAG